MNDISSQWPFCFAITYTVGEQRIFRKVMAARHAWVGYTVWAVVLGPPLVIGLVVLGGFELGSELVHRLRGIHRGHGQLLFLLAPLLWNFLFDDTGIAYKSEKMEVRLTWRVLDSVEDLDRIVLFLFNGRGISIPRRVFADDAARAAFVAGAAARIKAAAETAQA
jgi:hypothetical protein